MQVNAEVLSPPGREREEYVLQFSAFLRDRRMLANIEAMLLQGAGVLAHGHGAVEVSFMDLHDHSPHLALLLVYYPSEMMSMFEEALSRVQVEVAKHAAFATKHGLVMNGQKPHEAFTKAHVHIRLLCLPPTLRASKQSISDIRPDDPSCLIQFSGTVVRTGAVVMFDVSRDYKCTKRNCNNDKPFTVRADLEQGNSLPVPQVCPFCEAKHPREVEGSRVCVDYQEIKVQDQIERVAFGTMPRSVVVLLEADLVDRVNAGDDVTVVGSMVRQWRPVIQGVRCSLDIAVRANSILPFKFSERGGASAGLQTQSASDFASFWARHNKSGTPYSARDVVIGSLCPQLYGLFFVKLAVLLTLVGGSETETQGGVRRRSQSHLLLVGDPGCGKSQLMRAAALISPRSVLTTGIGSTGAGLTCTAVKEPGTGSWSIEAGALVLANDGLCCIDEFASIREADRATIHEAMEQQTLSVAKAGLVVKLNTRASVFASCNPKGGVYDSTQDLTTNTAIASPLLSRFDLVMVLLDTPERDWDVNVSTFLLQQALRCAASASASASASGINGSAGAAAKGKGEGKGEDGGLEELLSGRWKLGTLRQYVSLVKRHKQPLLSPSATELLQRYYTVQRQHDDSLSSASRATTRLLESLIRLTQAHARLMFRDRAGREDAVVAISLMKISETPPTLLDAGATLHSPFPADPQAFYREQEERVLGQLHVSRDDLDRMDGVGGNGSGSGNGNGNGNMGVGGEMGLKRSFSELVTAAASPPAVSAAPSPFPVRDPAPAPSMVYTQPPPPPPPQPHVRPAPPKQPFETMAVEQQRPQQHRHQHQQQQQKEVVEEAGREERVNGLPHLGLVYSAGWSASVQVDDQTDDAW